MQAYHIRRGKTFRAMPSLAGLTLILGVAGCDLAPIYQEPGMDLPGQFSSRKDSSAAALAQIAWWNGLGDPVLNRLVQQGLDQNLNIQQALERVREAEAVARGTGAQLSVGEDLGVRREGGSDIRDVTVSEAEIGVSWLIDIFRQARNRKKSALRELDAAYADADTARMLYLSQISEAYIDMRFFEASIALKRRDLSSRRQTLNQVQTVFDAGEATQLELTQAEALLSTTQAEIPVLQASMRRQMNRIATLLGVPAGSLNLSPGSQPVPVRIASVGVPADLIRNRPDIRAAERRYAASVSRIGVARADLFPSLSLSGNIGIRDIDGDSGTLWGFGPSASIPIFNQGALQAEVSVAESQARQNYLNWREQVLVSVEEVESALFAVGRYRAAVGASQQTVSSYAQSLDFSRTLSQNQEITLLQVIEAERRIAEARETLAGNLRQLAQAYVALNVALGAGYAADTPAGAG